jgi:ribonucleotide monophosphatase NagD (HAD superfamily)
MFGSAYASAVYISKILNFPKDKRVYVIGQEGLEEELDNVGVAHSGGSVSDFKLYHVETGLTRVLPCARARIDRENGHDYAVLVKSQRR